MESSYELWDVSLHPVELRLKNYFCEHPQYREHILTGEELADLILNMLLENPTKSNSDLLGFFHGELPDLLRGLFSDDTNYTDPSSLSAYFKHQFEKDNVSDNFDISVMRVFRHMPGQWHTNEYVTLFYSINGICPISLSDETVRLKEGDVMILAPNTLYATPSYGDESVLIYYLIRSSTFFDVFWKNLSDVPLFSDFFSAALNGIHGNPYLLFDTNKNPVVHRLLYQIYSEVIWHECHANHMANSLMSLLFLTLFRHHSGNVHLSSQDSFRWKQEYAQVLHYIQEHYTTITMDELVGVFHYSERQLNRIIQACSGRTFSQLRIELRMKRASELLANTLLSVQSISEMVGYSNLNAFYKVFSKYSGVSPQEWRKMKVI